MEFTFKEMVAVFKMAKSMVLADGKIADAELAFVANELKNFGALYQMKEIEEAGNKMESSEAFGILSSMPTPKKKYVCAYLGAICAVDGNVDPKETAMWSLISLLADFPTMNISEAIDYWSKN